MYDHQWLPKLWIDDIIVNILPLLESNIMEKALHQCCKPFNLVPSKVSMYMILNYEEVITKLNWLLEYETIQLTHEQSINAHDLKL